MPIQNQFQPADRQISGVGGECIDGTRRSPAAIQSRAVGVSGRLADKACFDRNMGTQGLGVLPEKRQENGVTLDAQNRHGGCHVQRGGRIAHVGTDIDRPQIVRATSQRFAKILQRLVVEPPDVLVNRKIVVGRQHNRELADGISDRFRFGDWFGAGSSDSLACRTNPLSKPTSIAHIKSL